ncbi:MAG: sigma-70 family RNA polymerase sigma factor [Actinobacteria bacterium]|nr:sigma-70 family RNA polymerase sigma factor [Actinomycetota bacterium]
MTLDPGGQDFAEFYASAKDDCLRTVLAVTGNAQDAEELVAEAFARAWAGWRKVRSHPARRAWVVRTALNARVSRWRRLRREVVLDQAEFLVVPSHVAADGVDGDLMAALLRLPIRQRQVVALRFLLGLDTADTARTLGLAQGTVRAHTTRALAALRSDVMRPVEGER